MQIQEANIEDHNLITQLTKESKDYWNYGADQIKKWDDDLTISQEYIRVNKVYNLYFEARIIGYYSYNIIHGESVKLDNLFIHPDFIGKGFGKILFDDFLKRIEDIGIKEITLDSDPNTEGFYKKFGFETIGKLETSIEGRFLPVMVK
jgi:N-acetylglutamate synthase-like GNAT family acetyltransferase